MTNCQKTQEALDLLDDLPANLMMVLITGIVTGKEVEYEEKLLPFLNSTNDCRVSLTTAVLFEEYKGTAPDYVSKTMDKAQAEKAEAELKANESLEDRATKKAFNLLKHIASSYLHTHVMLWNAIYKGRIEQDGYHDLMSSFFPYTKGGGKVYLYPHAQKAVQMMIDAGIAPTKESLQPKYKVLTPPDEVE